MLAFSQTGNRNIWHFHKQEIEIFSTLFMFKNRKPNYLAFSQTGNRIIWHFLKQEIEIFGIFSERKQNYFAFSQTGNRIIWHFLKLASSCYAAVIKLSLSNCNSFSQEIDLLNSMRHPLKHVVICFLFLYKVFFFKFKLTLCLDSWVYTVFIKAFISAFKVIYPSIQSDLKSELVI